MPEVLGVAEHGEALGRAGRVGAKGEFFMTRTRTNRVRVTDPRCEGLREAPQVDTAAPRLSWCLESANRDT